MFYSTKTYNNDQGLSCCYRQWKATHSHCQLLHGYSIGAKVIFGANTLDDRNWVMDFGGLADFKSWLKIMFDHTVLISGDDPALPQFSELAGQNLIDLRVLDDGVGCEKFAKLCYDKLESLLKSQKESNTALNPSVYIESVEIFEHGANSALYVRPKS